VTYVIAEPCIDVLDRACVEEYPLDCIYESAVAFTDDNARFFTDPLPGRDHPVASPGGAGKIGRIGADTALVAGYPLLST